MDFNKIDSKIQIYGNKLQKLYAEPEINKNITIDNKDTNIQTIVWYAQLTTVPSILLFIIIKDVTISIFTKLFSIVVYLLFILTLSLNPTSKEIPLHTINNYTISNESKEKGQELLNNVATVIKSKLF